MLHKLPARAGLLNTLSLMCYKCFTSFHTHFEQVIWHNCLLLQKESTLKSYPQLTRNTLPGHLQSQHGADYFQEIEQYIFSSNQTRSK